MNIFSYLVKLTIIAILVLNLFIPEIDFLTKYQEVLWDKTKDFSLWAIIVLESIIILFLIEATYESPIKKLGLSIKKFLYWTKNENINLPKKSLNSDINFVLWFFKKTLSTLNTIKDEFLHGKQIRWEVEIWEEIQEKLFTRKKIEVPSLNVVAKSKPAAEIGWDSYDIIQQEDNYYIYVWDATWHWVWAWFIMMMTNALISGLSKVYRRWNEILWHTNEIIKPRIKANLLMTLLLVRWNEKEKRLFFTWAWHEYLIIYKQKEDKCYKIKSGWMAIWMIWNIHKFLKEKEVRFEENDIAVLYSDWITEAINQDRKDWEELMFWEDRLIGSIKKAPKMRERNYATANSVFRSISADLSQFMWYKYKQLDDITLAVIEYKSDDYNKSLDYTEKLPHELVTAWDWTRQTIKR